VWLWWQVPAPAAGCGGWCLIQQCCLSAHVWRRVARAVQATACCAAEVLWLEVEGAVNSPNSLSHPLGRRGKWWELVVLAQLCCTWSERAKATKWKF
jgi:hypothetical protein